MGIETNEIVNYEYLRGDKPLELDFTTEFMDNQNNICILQDQFVFKMFDVITDDELRDTFDA